jgi:PTH1 family peptidyl-tRNA hydrolase
MTDLDKLFEALRGITRSKKESTVSTEKDVSDKEAFLIIGLGNPGRNYRETRHNIGFMVVRRIAEILNISFTRTKSKALITDGHYQGNRLYMAKPQTFMNTSGQAVSALRKFYKIPLRNVLIIYDEVDLPFGTLRLKPSGGSAGHKGMQSIIQQLGTQEIPRLRMGVGHAFGSKQAANYVLKPFSKDESEFLSGYLDRAAAAALAYTREGIDLAMTMYNRSERK